MALVRLRDNQTNTPSGRNVSPPPPTPSRQTAPRPNTVEKQIISSVRPFSHQSARDVEKRLPERQLLSRYRHVYAGKGGWFVSRTTSTPQINLANGLNNNSGKYLDVYRKELILRLSRDIFENKKHLLDKDRIVSNRVIGDRGEDGNKEVTNSSLYDDRRPKTVPDQVMRTTSNLNQGNVTKSNSKTESIEENSSTVAVVSRPLKRAESEVGVDNGNNRESTDTTNDCHNQGSSTKEISQNIEEIDVKTGIDCGAGVTPTKSEIDHNNKRDFNDGLEGSPVVKTQQHFHTDGKVDSKDCDNYFITSFKRAHTIIGTVRTKDNNSSIEDGVNERGSTQTGVNKQLVEQEQCLSQVNVAKDGPNNELPADRKNNEIIDSEVLEENVNNVIKNDRVKSAKNRRGKNTSKYALGEIELNVLRQRSFVKTSSQSNMKDIQHRSFSRGALKRSGKFIPRRMSQEALLAINETRKEMGMDKTDGDGLIPEENSNNNHQHQESISNTVVSNQPAEFVEGGLLNKECADRLDTNSVLVKEESHFNSGVVDKLSGRGDNNKNYMRVPPLDGRNTPPPTEQLVDSRGVTHQLSGQPSYESFNSVMDSSNKCSSGGDLSSKSQHFPRRKHDSKLQKHKLQVSSSEDMKLQLKLSAKNKGKGHLSTEATPVSRDLKLTSMSEETKQNSGRFSFNLSKEQGYNRHGSKRYFNNSSNIKTSKDTSNGISNPSSSVFLNSPRTKFPHLKLSSFSQEDLRKTGNVTTRSRNSSRKLSSAAEIPGESEDKLAPLKPKKLPGWKVNGPTLLTKEKSFQITPPGWDVRYKDLYGEKNHVDFNDDTPEEVKERAIEKCSDWIIKYM